MNFPRKTMVAALSTATLVLAALPADADAQVRRGGGWGGRGGHYGHWHGGGGLLWGGVGLGIGLGVGSSLYYGGPWAPGYVFVERPPTYYYDDDAPAPRAPAVRNSSPPPPEPVIYPRNGQSAAQTETDRQECNRWATTQESAMRDASVFQRATLACMDGRGYSVR